MNDDFEEDYDDEYEDYDEEESDLLEEIKDKYDEIKDKVDKYKNKKNGGNSSDSQQKAKEFDNQLKDKNMARSQNPSATTGTTTGSATGEAAATGGATTTGGTATAAGGTAAAGETAAAAGGTTAVAGETAATAGGAAAAGGAVAAQAAVPVVGWIALAVEAGIALLIAARKAKKKREEKLAENGIDIKGIKRLLKVSPILLPIAIIVLIIILLVQGETQDKVEFLNQAFKCFEGKNACTDFMNTKVRIDAIDKDLIKATDLQIAKFVVQYVKAENKYYGSNGSSFMSDIINDLNEVAKEGLVEDSGVSVIENIFNELVDNSIIGDTIYAWHLFKWMKVEKKVYQNIYWHKAYLDTASGYATLTELKEWYTVVKGEEPNIAFGDTVTKDAIAIDLNLFNAYLPTPLGVELDKCIEAARPYIPSWIEIYAVYVNTGSYDIANDVYSYYINKNSYKLEVTLYQLTTIKKIKKVENGSTKEYVVEKDGTTRSLTKQEFDNETAQGSSGFFAWLGDKLSDFISMAENELKKLIEEIAKLFGFNVTVTSEWVPIVTYGNAFNYKVSQDYSIVTEIDFEKVEKADQREKESSHNTISYTVEYQETVTKENGTTEVVTKQKEKNAKYYIKSTVFIDHEITTWTNKLQYVSTNTTVYTEKNRFLQIFMDIVREKDYKYTIDDVSIADEIIESFYGESYKVTGSSIDYSALPEGAFGWPVPSNKVVSALFGYTQWYGGDHLGIDIWAVDSSGNPTAGFNYVGRVDVVAAQSGTVIEVLDNACADGNAVSKNCGGTYGNHVIIQHENNYATMYAHLAKGTIAVSQGQTINAGTFLGKMGSSGNSTGTHLHYEIRFSGERIDPLAFYEVEPYMYGVPYESINRSGVTMANPYKVK